MMAEWHLYFHVHFSFLEFSSSCKKETENTHTHTHALPNMFSGSVVLFSDSVSSPVWRPCPSLLFLSPTERLCPLFRASCSCPTFCGCMDCSLPGSVTPWTVACQAPLSMGFSRQEYWSGLPFPPPRDLPDPEIEPRSLALQADSFPPGCLLVLAFQNKFFV